MYHHLNAMRREASAAGQESAGTRLGTISGYDHSNYLAKVMLQPDGVETGFLPIASIGIGNGWGIQVAPSIGDLVVVEFQDGGIDAGIITGRLFNNDSRPNDVPIGEVWLVHQGGQFIKMLTDGSISSSGTWNHAGSMNVTGPVTATQDIKSSGGNLVAALDVKDQNGAKSMAAMRTTFNDHGHTDPQGGSVGAAAPGM